MKKLIAVLLVLSYSSIAFANWTFVAESSNDNKFFFDFDTIQKKSNLVKIWQKVELSKPQQFSGENYQSIRTYREYDCGNKMERILSLAFFSQNNLNGNIVFTHSKTGEWDYVPPNTTGAELLKTACGGK